ncbi:InlB B-repeat-containing protein [Bifidobacterium sp. B4079]|nr:InlB B-repeat-containing protein [Bifidobacterium sp. B4079]
MSARAIGILLAVILPASFLAGGLAAADATAGSEVDLAAPATLGNAGLEDSTAPGAGGQPTSSTLTAAPQVPSSSPLATSSPLPSSSPLADAPGSTAGSQPQAQSSQTWTVSFDPAGGSSVGQQTILEGGQASRPSPDPSRGGYLFDGWFQGDIAYDFSQPVTRNITLTARWTSTDSQRWTISPTQGPAAGGAKTTLTPPKPRGIRFSQISLNDFHSAAIRSDGSLYAWGNNSSGQLGDGTTNNQKRPILVDKPAGTPNGFTWKQIILGSYYSAAFGSDGNLYTWGDNSNGTLGDGTTTDRPTPIKVGKPQGAPAGFTWKQVSLGAWHSAAIGSDGNLYTWGRNSNGQLGRGTNVVSAHRPGIVGKPQGAPAGFTWKQASLGWFHSAAIGSDGNLYTWGRNDSGQLGDGTTTDRNKPAKINGFTWKQISLNNNFSAGISSDGSLYTWGGNSTGQLGDGTTTNRNTPTLVSKPKGTSEGFTWKQISLGGAHSAAIGSDGQLYTWGGNSNGQLGDGTTTNRNTPTLIRKPADAPDGFIWKQISLGETHSAALGSDSNLYAWGHNNTGQLGDGTTTNRNTPVTLDFPGAATPTDVRFGQARTTGITANPDGTWQASTPKHDPGAVDVTVVWNRNGPQPDAHLQYTFIAPEHQVGFTSKDSACPAPTGMPPSQAVTQDGQAERPQPDPKADGCLFDGWFQDNVAYDFTQPVTHSITLTARWTRTDTQHWTISPAQGPEAGGTKLTLTPPTPRGIRFSQTSLGSSHSAGIGSDGNLYTWGRNNSGQLGRETIASRYTPTLVGKPAGAPDGFTWKQVNLGSSHSAAIGSDGNLYTWGSNTYGQLGDGTTNSRSTPVLVGKPQGAPDGFTWKQTSLGDQHSAAIGSDGNLYTWGYNNYGQLGDGTQVDKHTPTQVGKPQGAPDGFTWKQTSLGNAYSAAIGSDGSLYTWGSNNSSLLGREPSNAWPDSRPGPVGFPGKPQATSICFDQTRQQGACLAAGKNLTPNPDGTWNATTPAYTPGPVPTAIDWTQDGRQQQTDTSNTYRYLSIASLPLTGGNGMLLLLATGLLAAGAAAAAKNRRQQTQTNTSHE